MSPRRIHLALDRIAARIDGLIKSAQCQQSRAEAAVAFGQIGVQFQRSRTAATAASSCQLSRRALLRLACN